MGTSPLPCTRSFFEGRVDKRVAGPTTIVLFPTRITSSKQTFLSFPFFFLDLATNFPSYPTHSHHLHSTSSSTISNQPHHCQSCLSCRFSGSTFSTTPPSLPTTTSSRSLSSVWRTSRRVGSHAPTVHPPSRPCDVLTPSAKTDLEWKLTYVGSATSDQYDQELDTLLVGPIPVGLNKFIFEADAPDTKRIPDAEVLGVTVVLLTCAYDGREFVRVGYYVNNEYETEELCDDPPAKPVIEKIRRSILAEKPRVTRFAIKWCVSWLSLDHSSPCSWLIIIDPQGQR